MCKATHPVEEEQGEDDLGEVVDDEQFLNVVRLPVLHPARTEPGHRPHVGEADGQRWERGRHQRVAVHPRVCRSGGRGQRHGQRGHQGVAVHPRVCRSGGGRGQRHGTEGSELRFGVESAEISSVL